MYIAEKERYGKMKYARCGKSGIMLPEISLGLWHNFGSSDSYDNARKMVRCAFDSGITHFDLANNYGPEPGAAEKNFGKLMKEDFSPYRDEMIISTKAGYLMWEGPYGDGGSMKYMTASLDQSLKRMGLDYVDIFYSHRPDENTPPEETAEALARIYKQGKALYIGISNYSNEKTKVMYKLLEDRGVKCFIHQTKYSMLDRGAEEGLFETLNRLGVGFIAFSPLAQGMLSDKYLKGIPENSRAAKPTGFLKESNITDDVLKKASALNEIARRRGQTLAQTALCWVLRRPEVTSALIGASSPQQITENVRALDNKSFSDEEITDIERILGGE